MDTTKRRLCLEAPTLYLLVSAGLLLPIAPVHAKRPGPAPGAAKAGAPSAPAPPPPAVSKPAPSQDAIAAHERGDHAVARELFRQVVTTRPSAKLWSFLARESDETAAYDEELSAARACIDSIGRSDASGEAIKDRDSILLSCLFYRAEALYLMRSLAAASQAADECRSAAERDAPSPTRDRVLADCEKLTRELAPLVRALNEPKRVPLLRRPGFWAGVGTVAASALAVGLGVGLRPPADPTDIRTVQFMLRFH